MIIQCLFRHTLLLYPSLPCSIPAIICTRPVWFSAIKSHIRRIGSSLLTLLFDLSVIQPGDPIIAVLMMRCTEVQGPRESHGVTVPWTAGVRLVNPFLCALHH